MAGMLKSIQARLEAEGADAPGLVKDTVAMIRLSRSLRKTLRESKNSNVGRSELWRIEALLADHARYSPGSEGSQALAVLYLELGEVALAKVLMNCEAEDASCWNNLGLIHAEQGDHARAMDGFTRSLSIDNDNVAARLNSANVLLQYLDYPAAADMYRAVHKIEPRNPQACAGLELLLGVAGNEAEAAEVRRVCE